MRLRPLGPLLVAVTLLVSGCASGEDEPTTTQAAEKLRSWMGPLETRLTKDLETLQPWQPTDDASQDDTSGCEDGQARRTYAATLDVSDRTRPPDADNREVLLVGQLGREGWDWDSTTSSNDDVSGTVAAKRATADDTGTKLTVDFTPVAGGWHYVVTARSACLPTD